MEKKILGAFLHNHKLKFNEIEKITKIRSNKLTYHLKKLIDKNILNKKADNYQLTEISEDLIPYISDKKAVLPVILISIKNGKGIFLYNRTKRPYKDKSSLPGGRIKLGETIPQATERIMREKFRINCKFKKINSISLEHVKKNRKILHSFLLIFVTATTKAKIKYTNLKDRERIISSDYRLIKNDINRETKIQNIISRI
jgi:ADP-ribose pyrophosphatase YjhB (NUDIX family)